MSNALRHRGPDDAGCWADPVVGIALGHQRLSILDVSALGRQPMASQSGRVTVTYNGEIYNHGQLRRELVDEGVVFRSECDTEVLVEAIDAWGLEPTLEKLNGMFAFAMWDRVSKTLSLARDRMGIKPLYYSAHDGLILFGSELKALRAHPQFGTDIDRRAISLFLQNNYIPAPYTIYAHARKLPTGCYVTWRRSTNTEQRQPTSYWRLDDAITNGREHPFGGDRTCAISELRTRISNAVTTRMQADVPLGAFLSGGIDSSTVVAMMQQARGSTQTFSIGFEEEAYNEAPFAREVARHLGTQHIEHIVTSQEARNVIPLLAGMYDEPFADSSQIPTYLVSRLARQHVTVALSGDGGDELFGGYSRYQLAEQFWRRVSRIPTPLRRLGSSMISTLVPASNQRGLCRKLHTAAKLMSPNDVGAMYAYLHSHWRESENVVMDGETPDTILYRSKDWPTFQQPLEAFTYIDALTYLPDDILTKVDRASMAVGLEARTPLLDHELVEFVWSLPAALRFGGGESKSLLREVLFEHVPREMLDRPKVGFGIPLDSWLRGPLRDWAESLLDEVRLTREGYFHAQPIRMKWQQHVDGEVDWSYHLWDVLIFQSWLDGWA